jgi:hypothetical protein
MCRNGRMVLHPGKTLHLHSFMSSLVLNRCLHQVLHMFQRTLDKLHVIEHIAEFPFCRQSFRDKVSPVLLTSNSIVRFSTVKNGAG